MATIAENLQTIKVAVEDIKQAIIAKGGTVSGDLTTYANAIESLALGGGNSVPDYIVRSDVPNTSNAAVYQFLQTLQENSKETINFKLDRMVFYSSANYIRVESLSQSGFMQLFSDGRTLFVSGGGSGGAD